MKLPLIALAAVASVAVTAPAKAQVQAEVNVARAEGKWGGEVVGGYTVVDYQSFRVTPAVGAFLGGGDDDRYHLDVQADEPRCLDGDSGFLVDQSLCDNTKFMVFARLEATYTLPQFLTVGAGARLINGELRPYGTLAVPIGPAVSLKSNVGPKYVATGISARF